MDNHITKYDQFNKANLRHIEQANKFIMASIKKLSTKINMKEKKLCHTLCSWGNKV